MKTNLKAMIKKVGSWLPHSQHKVVLTAPRNMKRYSISSGAQKTSHVHKTLKQPNNSLNNDCNGRFPLGLGPLPKLVFNQLGGKGAITGVACNP